VPRLGPAPERPERFQPDPRTSARVAPSDYTNNGYDCGHLAPNYAIATRYGITAQEETFLMSNVIPQRHELDIATSYPARFGEVWVIVGRVFAGPSDPRPRRLDGSGPEIPVACFKIILDESAGRIRTLAFLFPTDTPRGFPIGNYLVPIDEIERRTGLDFFPALADVTESTLESTLASRVW
jgi:endonuclease G